MIWTSETSKNLAETLSQMWVRPYVRPRWMKGGPRRARVSDDFTNWCERREVEAIDAAGGAKEQNGKMAHRDQLFAIMLEDVITEVQPRAEAAWRECVVELVQAKRSLLSVMGASPMQMAFGLDPEAPGDPRKEEPG